MDDLYDNTTRDRDNEAIINESFDNFLEEFNNNTNLDTE